ncbi:MAG TPA: glycosyltransferase [Acidimicrobiales bacterium]|nr:glycosyltransferase [Acidimicrobiales bacterium]
MTAAVAIVHDDFAPRSVGARVSSAVSACFPGAPMSSTSALPNLSARHLLLAPPVFAGPDADVVVCVSSGSAHRVRSCGTKVVYCDRPGRALPGSHRHFRLRDPWSGATADRFLVSSNVVRDRVRLAYGIDAEVVPPPVEPPRPDGSALDGLGSGFVLAVGTFDRHEQLDAVAAAFRRLPHSRLVLVGDGPASGAAEAAGEGADVTLLGDVPDGELRWLYDNCALVVSASIDDFDPAPVVAARLGRPVAVLRYGAAVDAVAEGSTGVFFDSNRPQAIAEAITAVLSHRWDAGAIAAHARRYSEEEFMKRMAEVVGATAPLAIAAPGP